MSYIDTLYRIDEIRRQLQEMGPLPQDALKKVNYKFRLEWNYTSNSMEGNTLTESETRSVMIGNITVSGKPIKDVLEMKGHDEVVQQVMKMGAGELNLSESRIREIHKAIVKEDDPEKQKMAGHWKTQDNYVVNYKGEKSYYLPHGEVKEAMHQLMNWLSSEREKITRDDKSAMHPAILAFEFHLRYVIIHPFFDGNGRTARIFMNIILISFGYPPVWIKTEDWDGYYQTLGDIQAYGGNADIFYEVMTRCLLRSEQLMLDAVEGKEIEEPGDWKKKIQILKAQESDSGIIISKSKTSLINLSNTFILPFLEKLSQELGIIDELFFDRFTSMIGQNSKDHRMNIADLVQFLKTEMQLDRIDYRYTLKGYKFSKTLGTFNISFSLRWVFNDYNFEFGITNSDKSFNLLFDSYRYDKVFSTEEIDHIINACGKNLTEQIERNK